MPACHRAVQQHIPLLLVMANVKGSHSHPLKPFQTPPSPPPPPLLLTAGGWCTFGCRSGEKQGAVQTWLRDAAFAGAAIVTRCRAVRVLHREARGGREEGRGDKRQQGGGWEREAGGAGEDAGEGGGQCRALRKRMVVGLEAEIAPPDWLPAPRRKIIVEAPLVVAACGR